MKNRSILVATLFFFVSYGHSQISAPKTLDDKINLYHKTIKAAQSELLASLSKKNTLSPPIQALSLQASFAHFTDNSLWTEIDKKALSERHKKIAEKARLEAQQVSKKLGVSLESIRSQKIGAQFCADLPKGGMLHVHPWGTLDLETLKLILNKQNPLIDLGVIKVLAEKGLDENADGQIDSTLPQKRTESFLSQVSASDKLEGTKIRYSNLTEEQKTTFHDLFFIKDKTEHFTEFMGVFSLIFNTVFKKDSFSDFKFKVDEAMWDAFLQRAQKEKISYLEVTQTVNSKSGIEKYNNLKKNFKEKYGITVNSIAALDRRQPADKIYAQVEDLLSMPASDAVVGINLVANEDLHPAIQFKEAYALLRQKRQASHPQLNATIHSGEKGDLFNTRDALVMGVQRIGHGVLLQNDLLSLEYVRQNHIPIEINLLSNLVLDVAPSIEAHPFLFYHRLGIPVSLSTDDEGIFQSTLSRECEMVVKKTNIHYSEIKAMMLNSIKNSFAVESEKKQLLSKLEEDLKVFEKKYALKK